MFAKGSLRTLGTEFSYTARERLRRSGFPRSRLRGSGHRRGSLPRTSPSSPITSALILLRQLAKVSLVAPAARSSFHRARITAISSVSGQSAFVFVFVMPSSVGGRLLKARCLIRRNALNPNLRRYLGAPSISRPLELAPLTYVLDMFSWRYGPYRRDKPKFSIPGPLVIR
jgi:hypothetical protein